MATRRSTSARERSRCRSSDARSHGPGSRAPSSPRSDASSAHSAGDSVRWLRAGHEPSSCWIRIRARWRANAASERTSASALSPTLATARAALRRSPASSAASAASSAAASAAAWACGRVVSPAASTACRPRPTAVNAARPRAFAWRSAAARSGAPAVPSLSAAWPAAASARGGRAPRRDPGRRRAAGRRRTRQPLQVVEVDHRRRVERRVVVGLGERGLPRVGGQARHARDEVRPLLGPGDGRAGAPARREPALGLADLAGRARPADELDGRLDREPEVRMAARLQAEVERRFRAPLGVRVGDLPGARAPVERAVEHAVLLRRARREDDAMARAVADPRQRAGDAEQRGDTRGVVERGAEPAVVVGADDDRPRLVAGQVAHDVAASGGRRERGVDGHRGRERPVRQPLPQRGRIALADHHHRRCAGVPVAVERAERALRLEVRAVLRRGDDDAARPAQAELERGVRGPPGPLRQSISTSAPRTSSVSSARRRQPPASTTGPRIPPGGVGGAPPSAEPSNAGPPSGASRAPSKRQPSTWTSSIATSSSPRSRSSPATNAAASRSSGVPVTRKPRGSTRARRAARRRRAGGRCRSAALRAKVGMPTGHGSAPGAAAATGARVSAVTVGSAARVEEVAR